MKVTIQHTITLGIDIVVEVPDGTTEETAEDILLNDTGSADLIRSAFSPADYELIEEGWEVVNSHAKKQLTPRFNHDEFKTQFHKELST